MFKKILKKIMIAIVSIIGVLVVIYLLFTNYYPSFGGDVSKEQQKPINYPVTIKMVNSEIVMMYQKK
tara:strand:+ start:180 stop:380 length:201 start_codon:yes stop_codon:yes gene_type:complete